MKNENFIVINGVRYDAIMDYSEDACEDCDLLDVCSKRVANMCTVLFSSLVHFEIHCIETE